jgi:hypothetical protein
MHTAATSPLPVRPSRRTHAAHPECAKRGPLPRFPRPRLARHATVRNHPVDRDDRRPCARPPRGPARLARCHGPPSSPRSDSVQTPTGARVMRGACIVRASATNAPRRHQRAETSAMRISIAHANPAPKPRRRPPVPIPQQSHRSRHQQCAHKRRIEQHRDCRAQPERLDQNDIRRDK